MDMNMNKKMEQAYEYALTQFAESQGDAKMLIQVVWTLRYLGMKMKKPVAASKEECYADEPDLPDEIQELDYQYAMLVHETRAVMYRYFTTENGNIHDETLHALYDLHAKFEFNDEACSEAWEKLGTLEEYLYGPTK